MHRIPSIALFLVALFSVVVLEGCAGFSGHQLPTYTYEQLTKPSEKPAIEYSITAYSNERENAAAIKPLQERIDKVFRESSMFSSVKPGIGTTPYHLSIAFKDEGNEGLAFLSGFISGFTFLVIPGYAKAELVFDIDVKQGDRVLKRYQYRDSFSIWTQILLIFVMPFYWPPTVINATVDNMLLNFLHDLGRDGILQAAPSEP